MPLSSDSAPASAFQPNVSIREILRPFDGITGLFYIVKDHLSRVVAISPESVQRMGYRHENEVLGKLPGEYLPPELATHKYPLRDGDGKVVGVIAILQNLDIREKRYAHLGPVGDAADHIRTHLGEPLIVGEIARLAGYSERQLQRNFRRVFSQTIQQYIIASRINAAIHELTVGGAGISEIALKFGFSDQSAFSNCFKRFTGQPPHAYRVSVLAVG